MAGKHGNRSNKKLSKSTIQLPLEHESSSKRRKEGTYGSSKVSNGAKECLVKETGPDQVKVSTDDDLQQKFVKVSDVFYGGTTNNTNGWIYDSESDVNHQNTTNVVDHQPAAIEEPVGTLKANVVGQEAKEMLEAVEHRYPETFTSQRATIRSSRYWLSSLKELHVFIKGFLETSVDALTEDQITSIEGDLDDFERFGFNLSWARKRLEMVKNLKFGNDPLRLELMVLEESLKSSHKELVEANARLEKARLDYESATNARNKKGDEVALKFGDDYDDLLKGNLGLGMLPGY